MKLSALSLIFALSLVGCNNRQNENGASDVSVNANADASLTSRVVREFDMLSNIGAHLNWDEIRYETLITHYFKDGDLITIVIYKSDFNYATNAYDYTPVYLYTYRIDVRGAAFDPTVILTEVSATLASGDQIPTEPLLGFRQIPPLENARVQARFGDRVGTIESASSLKPVTAPPLPKARKPASEDEITFATIKFCQSYETQRDSQDCLKKFRGKKMDKQAYSICLDETDVQARVNCMEKIAGAAFADGIVGICASYQTQSGRIDCLSTFANKKFQLSEVMACDTEPYLKRKILCLEDVMRF